MRFAGLLLLAILFASRGAEADPEQSRVLDYGIAPEVTGCADARSFGELVAAHLGYDPFAMSGDSSETGIVRTRIRSKGAGLAATVELFDAHGASLGLKSLESPRCEDLLSAMSFAVAIAIDPARTLHANAAPKATATPTPEASKPPDLPPQSSSEMTPPPAAPTMTSRAKLRFEPQLVLAGGVAGFGPAAGVAPAFQAGAGMRYGAGSLEIEGRYLAPSSQDVPGGKVTTSTIGASLLPCAHVAPLFLCAEIFLGALQGSAEIQNQQGGTTFFSQAGIRAGVSIPVLASLRLEPFVDGLVTLTPTTLKFLANPVWSAYAVGVNGGIRFVLHFP